MIGKSTILFILTIIIVLSCDKKSDEIALDPETTALVEALDKEIYPLTNDPLNWNDSELAFLDPIADKPIIALGEATHGTSEFFNAKHRIFRYLVENHNYRIFAIEADFGESLLINGAIQRGATNEIALLMNEMHFWTWKTREVKDLLEWMSEYNLDKAEEDKVHYMGVDCQNNTFHPDMLKDYLNLSNAPFYAHAAMILDEAETASKTGFTSYSIPAFDDYLLGLDALGDSINKYKNELIAESSERAYELNVRTLRIIRQSSEVIRYQAIEDYSLNYRDRYMAENTAWLNEYFDSKKIVLWAHNGHISRNLFYGNGGSMGYNLAQDFGNEYVALGFLFSRGSFNAVGYDGSKTTALQMHTIDANPKTNSLNFVMSHAEESVFAVSISDLQNSTEWNSAFSKEIEYFQMGAVFDNNPENYYSKFDPDFMDYIIYFDETTASDLL